MNKTVTLERLNVVRDIFVFCTLTGLSFSDVEGLKPEHVSVDEEGNYWIHKARQKTNTLCSVNIFKPSFTLFSFEKMPATSSEVSTCNLSAIVDVGLLQHTVNLTHRIENLTVDDRITDFAG